MQTTNTQCKQCVHDHKHRKIMSEEKEQSQLEILSKSVEDFTVDFHKNIAGRLNGNFVISALSAHAALAMTTYGAKGKTKDEMRQSLHLSEDDQLMQQEYQAFIDILNSAENIVLKLANKIYASNSIEVKEKFREMTETFFRSECTNLDFSDQEHTLNTINKWCSDQTNGKITEIITADVLNNSIKMILLNAVYFKGIWNDKFYEGSTEMKPFHVNKTITINVPTMYINKNFCYKELKELNAEIVSLPYQNRDFCMLIIVPKEIEGVRDIEKNLEKIDFHRAESVEVILRFPKFKVETSINLEPCFTELGMAHMFSSAANFNDISNTKLKMDQAMQKAFIAVDEEGTEAAATFRCMLKKRCYKKKKPPVYLTVDRPFLYKIVYKDCTLFSGRIINPLLGS